MSDEICEIVITTPSAEWAAEHTRSLVEARLAACGHQFPIRSIYRWAGEIHDAGETRIALHTQLDLVEEVTRLTLQSHPYEVPCIIVQPIIDASRDYRAWVVESTTRAPVTRAMG